MSTLEQKSLDDRWQEYQRLDRIRNHWYWRPGWRVGRSFYTWHLTFHDAPALHHLVDSLQSELDLASLDRVPMDGLHLTMQGVGFTDAVSDADLTAIADAVRRACRDVSSFDLALGPVDPDAEGIGLLVTPWDPVVALRSVIRDSIGTVWSQVPESDDGFRPHVTLAYCNMDAPAEPIRERLARLRQRPPAKVDVAEAQLIRLDRDDKVYRWSVHTTARLGPPKPSTT